MLAFNPADTQEAKVAYYRQQAQEYIEAVNAKDIERVLAVFADDGVVNDPKWQRTFTGKDELRPFYEGVFTRARLEIVGPIRGTYGNAVAAPVVAHLPDRRVDVITITYFNDVGKVQTYDAHWGPTDVHPV
jgi:steroid Delta-isomerase